jgi:uncharacterized ferritin-like protein (DUF455 family)
VSSGLSFEIDQFHSSDMENLMSDYWMRIPEQIQMLNRLIFLEWTSARIIAGWVPAAKEFEWKGELCHFIWQNMQIANNLRIRKEELTGHNKITIPSERLLTFIQDVSRADSFPAFIAGWFLEVQKDQLSIYDRFSEVLDPIFDAPTLELLEDIVPKKRKQLEWAQRIIHDAVNDQKVLQQVQRWRNYTKVYLSHLQGLDEHAIQTIEKPEFPNIEPYGPAPKKRAKPDWLKTTSLDQPPEKFAHTMKIFMWHYATEIEVVDLLCYLLFGAKEMPFEFYVDLSRHAWDEYRHHQMGYRRLKQWGYRKEDIPLYYTSDAITELEKFYSGLTMIGESCSFSRKKKSMKSFYEKGDIISGMTAEIDIIDERNHVNYGKKWITTLLETLGDNRNLEQVVKDLHFEHDSPVISQMDSSERSKLTHFAFCGKIEFSYLNFDKL